MIMRQVTIPEQPTTEMIEQMAKGIQLATSNPGGMKYSDLLRAMACMAYMELFNVAARGEDGAKL